MGKRYVTANNWTVTVDGKRYGPSLPFKPVFVEGLTPELTRRLLEDGKIREYELPAEPVSAPDKAVAAAEARAKAAEEKAAAAEALAQANAENLAEMIEKYNAVHAEAEALKQSLAAAEARAKAAEEKAAKGAK